MCVDSLLLKFNSDEKQLTQLFISVFASDCILNPTQWWSLPEVMGGPCVQDRNDNQPPGHPMSVMQHYFSHK